MSTPTPPGKFDGPASAEALEVWEEYLDEVIGPDVGEGPEGYEQSAFTTAYDVGRRAGYEAARAHAQAWD